MFRIALGILKTQYIITMYKSIQKTLTEHL